MKILMTEALLPVGIQLFEDHCGNELVTPE